MTFYASNREVGPTGAEVDEFATLPASEPDGPPDDTRDDHAGHGDAPDDPARTDAARDDAARDDAARDGADARDGDRGARGVAPEHEGDAAPE